MRIHYMSDLHLEFGGQTINLPEGEVLVLAGDVTVARALDPAKAPGLRNEKTQARTQEFFEQASRNFAHVIYIAGNHEHYGGDISTTLAILHEQLDFENVRIAENEAIQIDGVTFLCSTLWTNMNGRDPATIARVNRGVSDFRLITMDGRLFHAERSVDLHEASLAWLRAEAARRSNERIVVVTHHAPSLQGLSHSFAGNGLNGAFASELESLATEFPGIRSWIFGHTHLRKTFRVAGSIAETTYRTNCAGYPGPALENFEADTWFEV